MFSELEYLTGSDSDFKGFVGRDYFRAITLIYSTTMDYIK